MLLSIQTPEGRIIHDASRVAFVGWSRQSLTCDRHGLAWTHDGVTQTAAWHEVLAVATLDVTAKLYGFDLARWMHLKIQLPDGSWVHLVSRDQGAFECAELALRHATPHIAQRLATELAAGREVVFGRVGLTRTTLRVGTRAWPLDRVAGYRAFQGYWMLDIGPDAPSLKAKIKLDDFINFEAFRILLEQLRPGLDYGPDPEDRGTLLRPSASSHDPRYLSGRGTLALVGGFAVVVLIVVSAILASQAADSRAADAQRDAEDAAEQALFAQVEGIAAQETAPFQCTQPLEPGNDNFELIGALGAAPGAVGLPSGLPILLKSDTSGLAVVGGTVTNSARYTVLGEVLSATAPRKSSTGNARIAMRVSERASGRVVCRGIVDATFRATWPREIEPRFVEGQLTLRLQHAAVQPICAAGGPKLCQSITLYVEPTPPPQPTTQAPPARKSKKARRGRR